MRRTFGHRLGATVFATCAAAALVAGCASGSADTAGGGGERSGAARIVGEQGDGGPVQTGGTLTYAAYSMPTSLDPARTQVAGTTGGTEMAAIYDLLIRHDSATNEFVPHLAQSMDESDDRLTWTMKLRDGVTFSDGTPLDANAVVASIDRVNRNNSAYAQLYVAAVAKTDAVAPDTVTFTMTSPWSAFPAMFTFGHGMVTAPAAEGPDGQFTPIGAGPFTLGTFDPPESIELVAREDYWDGRPNLDAVRIVNVQGDQPKIDTLVSGGVDMIFLRNSDTVNVAKERFAGYVDPVGMGQVLQINQRAGHAGSDVRVRQAIAYAVDPAVVDQRARGGEGMPGSVIFQEWSQWRGDVPGIEPDPEKARRLLDEAKADGFDGKATYLSIAEPNSQANALAIQAQLNAVGFDVTIDYVPSVTDMVKRLYVDKDFDLGYGATSLFDAAPEIRLYSAVDSKSTNNISGVDSPEFDAALDAIQSAPTHEDKVQAFGTLQTLVNEQVPFVNLGATEAFIGWDESVYGVNPSLDGILLLQNAWIRK
ncbi:ABC transporter substrate-binding protein [Prescottella sp. R16]|uniref:ABC transporter substrate-binding protein n=1 Tax=Prescottella sp. R16 TaxID=3064529 RepID=UPI00272EC1CD|nr:ABC transporter substrate-binding protein [Prescottella sp. R16]